MRNPTLGFARDLELLEWLDHLGYDEAWIGEHHLCRAGKQQRCRRFLWQMAAGAVDPATYVSWLRRDKSPSP